MFMAEEIILCKECGHPEYWGELRWLSGRCMCRGCYRKQYEKETGETVTLSYVTSYNRWDRTKEVEVPKDAGAAAYFYRIDPSSITLYREPQEHVETEDERRHQELRETREQQKAQLEAITMRHFQMRRDFINNYSGLKARCDEIIQLAVNALLGYENYYTAHPDMEILAFLLGIDVDEDTRFTEDKAQVMAAAMDNPPYPWPLR